MQPLTASQLAHHILRSIAEAQLLGTGTNESELNEATARMASKAEYRQALLHLGRAARKALRDRDLPQAREDFRSALEDAVMEPLKHSKYFQVNIELSCREGDDKQFLETMRLLQVLKP